MKPQVLMTTKSELTGSVTNLIAIIAQQSKHPFAIDEVFGASKTDEGVSVAHLLFGRGWTRQRFFGVLQRLAG